MSPEWRTEKLGSFTREMFLPLGAPRRRVMFFLYFVWFDQKSLQLHRVEKTLTQTEEELNNVRQSYTLYKNKVSLVLVLTSKTWMH